MLVFEKVGLPNKRMQDGDIGIEVEVEGRNLPRAVDGYRVERDGSLKAEESLEYVFKKPHNLVGARKMLLKLEESYQEHNTRVDDSVRAGVHVHINVQQLTTLELFTMMVVYVTLEDLLLKFCGTHREGNLFCLRSRDAEWVLFALEEAARHDNLHKLHSDHLRYSSMNVKALAEYGSLEFRAMRGTRDLKLIGDWAEILLTIRDNSKGFNNPAEVMEVYSNFQVDHFMDRTLGKWAPTFRNYPQYEAVVMGGMRRAQMVAYATDWEHFDQEVPAPHMDEEELANWVRVCLRPGDRFVKVVERQVCVEVLTLDGESVLRWHEDEQLHDRPANAAPKPGGVEFKWPGMRAGVEVDGHQVILDDLVENEEDEEDY